MSSNPKVVDPDATRPSNREKHAADWTTGDVPVTGAQESYLKKPCEEAKEAFDPTLSKAQALRRIGVLEGTTGLGR